MRKQPFTFMAHAIDQFIARFSPTMTRPQATTMLGQAACSAMRRKSNTRSGDEVWHCQVVIDGASKRIDCVIKRDGPGRGHAVCVTVLPEGAAEGYVHERRISLPTPTADPTGEALRVASRYVIASAGRGEERAIRVLAELEQLAPWVVASARGQYVTGPSPFGEAIANDSETTPAREGTTG